MGHGWVIKNPDGSVARCGGPTMCKTCQQEAGMLKGRDNGGRMEDPRQLELPLTPIRHQYIPPNPPMHLYVPQKLGCHCTGPCTCQSAFR